MVSRTSRARRAYVPPISQTRVLMRECVCVCAHSSPSPVGFCSYATARVCVSIAERHTHTHTCAHITGITVGLAPRCRRLGRRTAAVGRPSARSYVCDCLLRQSVRKCRKRRCCIRRCSCVRVSVCAYCGAFSQRTRPCDPTKKPRTATRVFVCLCVSHSLQVSERVGNVTMLNGALTLLT